MEDLDLAVSRREFEASQLRDLAALGLDWDGEVVRQSEREGLYRAALDRLFADDLVYECFCSRREIQQAAQAPNGPDALLRYPGTCRSLTRAERSARIDEGRPPAMRFRSSLAEVQVFDELCGPFRAAVDDLVLKRNDGTYAYNLAVVVDDDQQGVELVVRGDDLLPSTPSQAHLASVLGLRSQQYVHVPLVLSTAGVRLAKRDGAVTLGDRRALGETDADVLRKLGESLGLSGRGPSEWLHDFDVSQLPREPWVFTG
jgi:glutamyl-tRNA synthetase